MTTLSRFRRQPAEPVAADEIETYAEAFEVTAGQVVMQQGEPAGGFFVVLSGEYVVLLEVEPRPVVLATLGPGACFGETGLLQTGVHTATVRATTDGEVVVLTEPELRNILNDAAMTGTDLPTAAWAYVSLLEWTA
jgi:CRP-like cAMP-binding protein